MRHEKQIKQRYQHQRNIIKWIRLVKRLNNLYHPPFPTDIFESLLELDDLPAIKLWALDYEERVLEWRFSK